MNEFIHPRSSRPIHGMRLGPGTKLRETDQYDCSDGSWRPAGEWAGTMLQSKCPTVWVRPGVELSPEGRELLRYLSHHPPSYGLTTRGSRWIVIPSAKWKYDGRMEWKVMHPECVPELIDYGFIAPQPVNLSPEELGWERSWPQPDDEIYHLTEAGQATASGT